MVPASTTATDAPETSSTDFKFKFALKNMLPIPSNSEQEIILDEYNSQLTQFSIAINRIIREEVSDENCVYLLKLMAGMYTLLKTTLLSPLIYQQLFEGVTKIEFQVQEYFENWFKRGDNCDFEKQVELFELAWWCESALPRSYLICLLFASLPLIQSSPEHLSRTFSACKSVQHPLKGSFLYSHLHSFLKQIYFSYEDEDEENKIEMQTLSLGYSVECFTTLLRYFCRWNRSLPSNKTEATYTASLYEKTLSKVFQEVSKITSFDMFETILLPTMLVEVVNCGDNLAQTLVFTSIIKEFDSQYLMSQLGPLIKSSGQFAQGIDLRGLLDQLFSKVQSAQTEQVSFFSTIWEETSKLIKVPKNRCEIDQCDTVLISSLVISLIVKTARDEHVDSIKSVLDFLIKTLKTLRPEGERCGGFNSETSKVGAEIVHLIKNLMEDFEGSFEEVILKLENLPELLDCLTPSSSRKCCLNQILPKLKTLNSPKTFPEIIKLFSCLTKSDLTQLLGEDCEEDYCKDLNEISQDLKEFAFKLISILPSNEIKSFFESIDNSGSCLNLFLIPEFLEKSDFNPNQSRALISSLLQNTSTVLPRRLDLQQREELQWIEPEFTKLMACKMNLRVIEVLSEMNCDPYDFYTEILTILNFNVSQDYLKMQIIENCLNSFEISRKCLKSEDFTCLLDHLSKESCQLLKKTDRCKLLLKICDQFSCSGNNADSKIIDQISILLHQLPPSEEPQKFDLILKFLDLVMRERRLKDDEIVLFRWADDFVRFKDSGREVQFYTIKLQYEQYERDTEGDTENDIDKIVDYTTYKIVDYTNDTTYDTADYTTLANNDNTFTTDDFNQTEEDLQKLKIFASFQL